MMVDLGTNSSKERNDALGMLKELENKNDVFLDALTMLSRLTTNPSHNMKYETKTRKKQTPTLENFDCDERISLTSQLYQLCESPHLRDTSYPLLLMNIQRLTSNLQQVTKEAYVAQTEIREQEKYIKEQSQRLEMMEEGLKKLYKTHTKIKRKVKALEKENENLLANVGNGINPKKRMNVVNLHQNQGHQLHLDEKNQKTEENVDEVHSASPIVTMTGIKTLTLKQNELKMPKDNLWSMSWDSSPEASYSKKLFKSPGLKKGSEYKISFHAKSKIGLHFYQMPIDRNGNILDKDNVSSVEPHAIENRLPSPKSTFRKKVIDLHLPATKAFLVCGYDDFDTSMNEAPPIGSRLVKINDLSLEVDEWTIEKVIENLGANPPIVLSFQDYSLTAKQLGVLTKASEKLQKAKNTFNTLGGHGSWYGDSTYLKAQKSVADQTKEKQKLVPLLVDFPRLDEKHLISSKETEPHPTRPTAPETKPSSPTSVVDKISFRWN